MKQQFILFIAVAVLLNGCAGRPDMKMARLAANAGDTETARRHYEALATFGIPEAQLELAMLDLKQSHSSADSKEAVALLEKAAADNNPRAIFELGKLYQEGKKVRHDIPKARELLYKARDLGYVRAYYQLGDLAEDQKKYKEAEALYRESYAKGYFRGAARIGALYKNGKAYPIDLVQALAWYYLAQQRGVTGLEPDIAAFESKLGTEKSSEAFILSKGLY